MNRLAWRLEAKRGPLIEKAVELLDRHLRAQNGAGGAEEAAERRADLVLAVEPGIGQEGYRISDDADGAVRIAGNDERGMLYGIGRFLHSLAPAGRDGIAASWRGTSVPRTRWRGIYIANNFNNWNRTAPIEEFIRYMEELALWGLNTLAFNFNFSSLQDPSEPGTAAHLSRCRRILDAAHTLGIRTGLLVCANADCPNPPPELVAPPFPDATPARRGYWEGYICPSRPEGRRMLIDWFDHCFALFRDSPVDFVTTFPYDAGGCGCKDCWPWGARGYLRISEAIAELAKKHFGP